MGVSQPKKSRLAGKTRVVDKNQDTDPRSPMHNHEANLKAPGALRAAALESIIDAMSDAAILYDNDGKPVYANAVTIEAYGFDPANTTREDGLRRLAFRDLEGHLVTLESTPSTRALQGETVQGEVYCFTGAQGVERFMQVTARPVIIDGAQVGAVSIWRDVTEREMLRAETRSQQEALAQNRDMMAQVMKDAPVAIEILEGPEFRCVYTNDAFERLAAGRGRGDLVGHTVSEAWPEVIDHVLPMLRRAFETGEPFHAEEMAIPVMVGGRQETCYYSFTYTPVRDSSGKVTAILDQVIDVTEQVRARHAIETERDHLRALLESIDDEVWFCDPAGTITLVNDSAARGLDLKAFDRDTQHNLQDDVLHRLVIYNLDGTTRTDEDAPLIRALRGEHWRGGEIVHNPRTGRVMHRHTNASPIRSRNGEILGAVAVVRDITDIQQTQQALREKEAYLRESEARFGGTFENAAVGLAHVGLDGRFLRANPRLCQITGYSREELEQKTFQEISHPDDLQRDLEQAAQLRAGEIDRYTMEKRYYRRDGSIIWVNLTVGIQTDSAGRPDYFIISVEDITDRKAGERALQAAVSRLEYFVNSNMVGIVIGDATGRIREANDYYLNLIGYARADLESDQVRWIDITPVEHLSADRRALAELARRGACEPYEKEYIRKDGSRVWVLVGETILPDGQIMAFVLDASERKRAEFDLLAREAMLQRYADELAQSNRDLENFAFVASHDLQEPLRKITSFGDILQDRLSGQIDDATEDLLNRMINAGERMKAMINGLLQLSRVNTRGQAFEPVDLNVVASEVVSDLEPAIERVGGQVLVDPLPSIEGDPLQMRLLLQNLISNGLKFHKPDVAPLVRVAASAEQDRGKEAVALAISDNGIGFETQYFDRILQPFQRLHGRGEYEGTGIGLAICKRIVERHHGQIRAESTLGEGSTFIVELPVKQ